MNPKRPKIELTKYQKRTILHEKKYIDRVALGKFENLQDVLNGYLQGIRFMEKLLNLETREEE